MKPNIILATFCVIFLGLIACNRTAKPGNGSTGDGLQAARDSIDLLDSLVLIAKFNNRSEAIHLSRKSLKIAIKSDNAACLALACNTLGNAFNQYDIDSACYYYSFAQKTAEKSGVGNHFPQILYNIAQLNYQALDYKTAIVQLDSVINMCPDHGQWKVMADAWIVVGNIKANIGLVNEALIAFQKAEALSNQRNLPGTLGISLANRAKYETDVKDAIRLNQEAIVHLSETGGNEHSIAGIYNNIGISMNDPDSAICYYQKSLKIAKPMDFSDLMINAYNNMAYSYLEKGDISMSEKLVRDIALPMALADTSFSDLATLYDTYADVLKVKRNYQQALEYQKMAMAYRSRADQKIAGDQTRLLSALLEAKNRDLLIQNQEMEIRIQSGKNVQYRTYLLFVLVLLMGSLLSLVWYRQRSRLKLQRERLESAQRIIDTGEYEKKQVGRELHDISTQLSMGLKRTVDDSDFASEADRDRLLEEVETVRKTIRSLSHRMHADTMAGPGLQVLLTRLCREIKGDRKIQLDESIGPDLPELNAHIVLHCYRIVQELLTNAMHHAPGSEVELEIYYMEHLYINYHDNGPGFDMNKTGKTMGMLNIKDRLTLLGGSCEMSSAPGAGTSWEIVIPVISTENKTNLPS
jgi:signal transduction histidine kinase